MNKPYIYQANQVEKLATSTTAIVVLPDIFMQTDYAKTTVEDFATEFKQPVFLLDYFYDQTGQVNCFGADDREKAFSLMEDLQADHFRAFFHRALEEIKQQYPTIEHITVVGFCFGGRLAYIAGAEHMVTQVVSLYGAGAHTPNYIGNSTPVQYLIDKRQGETNIAVLAFFGNQDQSIPAEDRAATKAAFAQAKIPYQAHDYAAGHAYFQAGRPNYDEAAAQASWTEFKQFLAQE